MAVRSSKVSFLLGLLCSWTPSCPKTQANDQNTTRYASTSFKLRKILHPGCRICMLDGLYKVFDSYYTDTLSQQLTAPQTAVPPAPGTNLGHGCLGGHGLAGAVDRGGAGPAGGGGGVHQLQGLHGRGLQRGVHPARPGPPSPPLRLRGPASLLSPSLAAGLAPRPPGLAPPARRCRTALPAGGTEPHAPAPVPALGRSRHPRPPTQAAGGSGRAGKGRCAGGVSRRGRQRRGHRARARAAGPGAARWSGTPGPSGDSADDKEACRESKQGGSPRWCGRGGGAGGRAGGAGLWGCTQEGVLGLPRPRVTHPHPGVPSPPGAGLGRGGRVLALA